MNQRNIVSGFVILLLFLAAKPLAETDPQSKVKKQTTHHKTESVGSILNVFAQLRCLFFSPRRHDDTTFASCSAEQNVVSSW